MESVWEKVNYITSEPYVSGNIYEYDIKSANISILRKYNKIDEAYYQYLSKLPKISREMEIGRLIRQDRAIYETISEGIREAKKELCIKNNISEDSIVRVANDAVYINSSVPLQHTVLDEYIEFKEKSKSVSMLNIMNVIFFLRTAGNDLDVTVKGISEENQLLHKNYMISIISNILYELEFVGAKYALSNVVTFYKSYITRTLDINYYRELNAMSKFNYKNAFLLDQIGQGQLPDICIDYNAIFLRELYDVVLEKSL